MPPSPLFRSFSIPTRNWYAPVVASDGHIYAWATDGTNNYEMEIDPDTETYTEHTTAAYGNSPSGVAIGSIVYRFRTGSSPVTNNRMRTFDTTSKTFGWFGVGSTGTNFVNLIAVGTKIFGFDGSASFKVIDTVAQTGLTKSGLTGGGATYNATLIGTTIYLVISGAVQMIDTVTETYAGSFSIPARSWSGAALAPNGLIYALSVSGSTEYVCEIDPIAQTYTEYSYSDIGDGGLYAVLAMTGDIYYFGSDEVYRVTPGTIDFTGWASPFGMIGAIGSGGAVLAPNGKIFAPGWSGYCGVIDWRKLAGRGIGLGRGPRMIGTT